MAEVAEAPTVAPPAPEPAVPKVAVAPEAGLPTNPMEVNADLPQSSAQGTSTVEALKDQRVQIQQDEAAERLKVAQQQSGGGSADTGKLPNTGGGFLGGFFRKLNPFK